MSSVEESENENIIVPNNSTTISSLKNEEDVDVKMEEDLKTTDYFESYENIDVHRLMLQDEVRTNAYNTAISDASTLFEGKVVMDVGAGTGILSLFCAKAGAKKVYSIEASSLAELLPEIAEKNGFSNVIEIIHSRVEDVELDCKVDILVSEWMGFYLLHESMLDSVLFARDKFLNAETGLMFPNSAQIYAAPCSVPELWKDHADFWLEKQYGFDLSPFSKIAKIKTKPEIFTVASDGLLSDPQLLWDFNLQTVDKSSLKSLRDRRFFSIEEDGDMHAVCMWFTCTFPTVSDKEAVTLSTAPWDSETHWKQTVILFPTLTTCEAGDIVGWEFNMEKESLEPLSRSYKIHFRWLDDDEEHPVPCLCLSLKCEIIRYYIENPQLQQRTDEITNE